MDVAGGVGTGLMLADRDCVPGLAAAWGPLPPPPQLSSRPILGGVAASVPSGMLERTKTNSPSNHTAEAAYAMAHLRGSMDDSDVAESPRRGEELSDNEAQEAPRSAGRVDDPDTFLPPKLTKKKLEKLQEQYNKRGIVYMSRLPPHLVRAAVGRGCTGRGTEPV